MKFWGSRISIDVVIAGFSLGKRWLFSLGQIYVVGSKAN